MPANSLFRPWAGALTSAELADDLAVVVSDLGVALPKGRGATRLWAPRHWALRRVNFELKRGETIGVLGRNGSGKSTLLRTLAGIITPDEGGLRLAPNLDCVILAPGAGFDNDLTGRENIFSSALFHGHLPDVVKPRVDDIVAFAEIGDWIDEPVGIYSAGMRARLGFALSLFMPSDVLMIDETLSAGDITFRDKAREAIMSLVGSGRTVIVVSHNVDMMRSMCTRGIVLDAGLQIACGDIEEMIATYQDRTIGHRERVSIGDENRGATYTNIDIDEKAALLERKRAMARLAWREAYVHWMNSEQALADASTALISVQEQLIAHLRTRRSGGRSNEALRTLENRWQDAREARDAAKAKRDAHRASFVGARSNDESLLLDLQQLRGTKQSAAPQESEGEPAIAGEDGPRLAEAGSRG